MSEATLFIDTGIVHEVPDDVQQVLIDNRAVLSIWNKLTARARNEWICWIISVKKPQTRAQRITRMCNQLQDGVRRPCCWPGCPHINPNAARWFKKQGNI